MNKSARFTLSLLATCLSATGVPAQAPAPAVTAVEAAPTRAEPRFDLNVDNAPARAFFLGLVDGTPHNMLVHPDVRGQVSMQLKQVTVEEVLSATRELYGFDYRRVSTGYLVLPATLQTRMFHLNYLDLKRLGVSKTRISSGQITESQAANSQGAGSAAAMGEGSTGDTGSTSDVTGTSVVTQNSSDFWESIAENLKAIIGVAEDKSGERSVVVNRQSGVVVVRAMPGELRDVADYLVKTEATVTRQVVLEAKIVEVELNDAYQAGINWAGVLTNGGDQYFIGQSTPRGGLGGDLLAPPGVQVPIAPGNPINGFITNALGGAFTLAADLGDFNAFIELLGLQGRTRVLSSPRVSTLHNQKAVIKAGSDEFFVTGISSDTTTGESTTTTVDIELTPFFSGVALDVTPQINDQGEVLMHIHPTVSDVTDQQKELSVRGQTDSLPLALSQIRESDSIVRARSGQVIVIGGLMRQTRKEQDYKTPFLGDVPGIGRLFRSERNQSSTVELVILLRPLVVSDNDWTQLVRESDTRIEDMTRKAKLGE
jgi:MSHA biogenesis protein MshL